MPPVSLGENILALQTEMDVSRETFERLSLYVALIRRWQKILNLVSNKSLDVIWTRHVADSAQLRTHAPKARVWADLGSGGGFPGLVIAIQLIETPGALMHLIESDQRKCVFLREVIRETGAKANVHCGRIEAVLDGIGHVDAITARGLVPLDRLLELTRHQINIGAVCIFPRGLQLADELTRCTKYVNFDLRLVPSRTSETSRIVVVRRKEEARRPEMIT